VRSGLMAFAVAMAVISPMSVQARSAVSADVEPVMPFLEPGKFVWFEQPQLVRASTDAGQAVRIVISIGSQQAKVYQGNRLVGATTVSTGAPGYDTPVGEFTILQKKVFHRSNLYSDAPMPYMQRLTWDGIALHAGQLPGYPASHGCIRMPKAFARQLYDLTAMGGTVSIVDEFFDLPLDLAPASSPTLTAETGNLGGNPYNVLTMAGDPPADAASTQPISWASGSANEVIQPLPGQRGSR